METIKIVALAVAAAVIYGVLHDQITARVCVEYFTIGHPPIFHTNDPTLLGLGWGVIATWWVGFFLGVPLAAAARIGSWPKRNARSLVRLIMVLMICCGVLAVVAGIAGYVLASLADFSDDDFARRIPHSRYALFIADWFAHLASYGGGFLGGVIIWIWVVVQRWRHGRKCAQDQLQSPASQ